MHKERYKEEYEEGSDLLWPSDKEDKITRQFYKDLSDLSKNINYSKKKKLKLFEQVIRIIKTKENKIPLEKLTKFFKNLSLVIPRSTQALDLFRLI